MQNEKDLINTENGIVESDDDLENVTGGKFVGGKEKFNREKPHTPIGTTTGKGHEKTTLIAKVTSGKATPYQEWAKPEPPEEPEEKTTGITIN